jgi:mannose-6-phosphate isomerase-like protein (cupin superfamily)
MTGYNGAIEKLTTENTFFRKVLFTAPHSQLVLMSLKPSEDIGEEIHEKEDQFFQFEAGEGKVKIDGEEFDVADGDAVIVPAGSKHNVINTSEKDDLKLYTIYSPAHHPDGTVHKIREDAMKAEDH